MTPYGDRRAMVADPWGNRWQIATRAIVLTHRFQSRMPAAARSPAATTKLA